VGVIARREYRTTVRRREFLFITFGLPLVYLALAALVMLATASAVGSAARRREGRSLPKVVGFYDASRTLNAAALAAGDDGLKGRLYGSEQAGKKAVQSGGVRAFVAVPADFGKTGEVTVYLPPARDSLFGPSVRGGVESGAVARALRRALLTGKTDTATIATVLRPVETERLNWDPKAGRFARPDPLRSLARFAVPYGFSLVLLMSVMFSSSYLLHGIVDEKENRIIEVLLSAATHEELLAGKLIGLGAAGLTQLAVWLGTGVLLGGVARLALPIPPALTSAVSLSVGPGLIASALLLFLGGYALYAALMVGIGSFGTSWRESQQIAGILAFALVIPLLALPVLLEEPDGALARWLSLIPFTAPIGMILRVAAGGSSAGEVALAVLLLAAATAGAVALSARLFRLSLLLYGQRPTPALVWRTLRGGTA
jgi:ABC-2 type transport system permease protein